MFNGVMTDAELIQLHGGSSAVARKLKFEGVNGARRVHNWKSRGIPAQVKLDNPWLNSKNARARKSTRPTKEAADV